MLNAILGELPTFAGEITVKGKISYASQEAWVFSGTLRENVLFGQAFDPERYAAVTNACALSHDIKKLDFGDETMVGERGVALSGGQKARVNLARAIYRDADVYLLDDPLSAVDSHVGRHLFDECIKKYLKSKVVILVTHQLQYLKGADNILVLNKGTIAHMGDFDAIMKSGADISSFMSDDKKKDEENADNLDKDNSKEQADGSGDDVTEEKVVANGDAVHAQVKKEDEAEALLKPKKNPGQEEETAKEGTINKKVYFDYIKSGTNLLTGFVLTIATILTHSMYVLSDLWLRKWTNAEDLELKRYESHLYNDTLIVLDGNETLVGNISQELEAEFAHIEEDNRYNLMIYAVLILSLVVATGIQTVQYYVCCMTASRTLHNRMFDKILRAPTRFFDLNPTGRILNRFSKDTGSMDELLPSSMLDVKWLFLNIMCVFLLVVYIRPIVFFPTVLVGGIFIYLRRFYLLTSR